MGEKKIHGQCLHSHDKRGYIDITIGTISDAKSSMIKVHVCHHCSRLHDTEVVMLMMRLIAEW